jgi:hypothetical protein
MIQLQSLFLKILLNLQTILHEDIGDFKFCCVVDKTQDESKRKQIDIVLKFVDKYAFTRIRMFGATYSVLENIIRE